MLRVGKLPLGCQGNAERKETDTKCYPFPRPRKHEWLFLAADAAELEQAKRGGQVSLPHGVSLWVPKHKWPFEAIAELPRISRQRPAHSLSCPVHYSYSPGTTCLHLILHCPQATLTRSRDPP